MKFDSKPTPCSAARIIQMSQQMRQDAYMLDLDRAELIRHYGGGALEVDDTQGGKPRTGKPNILTGFKFLSRPAEQLLATYDEGLGFLEAQIYDPETPPTRRRTVEAHLNREVNLIVQRSERMFWPYKACVTDAVISGIGVLYRDDPYDWTPKYGRPYYPWNAPADITDDRFADWCFLGELTASEIISRLDRLAKTDDEDSHWDKERLREIVNVIVRRHRPEQHDGFQLMMEDDPVAWREQIQTQSWGERVLSASCPVVWFFSKRFENDGKRPIDLYCVPRWGEVTKEMDSALQISTGPSEYQNVLFYQPTLFEDIRECFFPYLLSCMLGGEPLMRRTMGLGTLMYDLDIRVQQSINNMFDATDFDFSPLFQAQDSQSEMELQELAATRIRSYDILPSGARFMDKPKGSRPYTSVFELTQLMSSEMGAQAHAFHGGGADSEPEGRKKLEVEVLERRQQMATALRLRMNDFIRRADPMAQAIGEVLVNAELYKCDRAWPQRQELKECLKNVGVEWKEVHKKAKFSMRRPPGHGDPGLALYRAQQTEQVARGLGPEAHREAQRNLISALNGGDTLLANELVPQQIPGAGQQEDRALSQSSTALSTGMPPPVLETDNPMAHVPVHMSVLQGAFANASEAQGKWSRQDQRGFEALAAHTLADNSVLGSFNPQMAGEVQKAVKQMITKAATFEITGAAPPIDPVDQAKLQLAARTQQAKEAKMADDIRHRNVAQTHREEQSEFQNNLQIAHLSNAEKDSEVKRATNLATTAKEIATPIKDPNKQTSPSAA